MSTKCKLILVGEAGVGKTCLIKQYLEKSFDSEEIPTIASQEVFKEITINNQILKLTIWDTCGQEKFRSINKIFMKSSDIVILVYDITDRKSFEELDFWYNDVIQNIGNNIVIGIAANKTDLIEDESVHSNEGNKYAEKIGAIFKETTATTHEAIEELIEELSHKFIEKKKNKEQKGNIKVNYNYQNKKKCCKS